MENFIFFLTYLLKKKRTNKKNLFSALKCDEENLKKWTSVNDFFMFSSKLELILFLSGNIQRHHHKKNVFHNANALITAYKVHFYFESMQQHLFQKQCIFGQIFWIWPAISPWKQNTDVIYRIAIEKGKELHSIPVRISLFLFLGLKKRK